MNKTCIPLIASSLLLAAIQAPAIAGPGEEARKHVDMAQTTISNFLRDPNMGWLQSNLPRAKGLLIVPKVVKAGFVFGGSGGRGVLLVRDNGGEKERGGVFCGKNPGGGGPGGGARGR